MTVYVLSSSWNYCGNNSVNEIEGIFKNLIDAQKCLCKLLYNDCNFCGLKHYEDDCELELIFRNFFKMTNHIQQHMLNLMMD